MRALPLIEGILVKSEALELQSRSFVESPHDYGQRIYPHVNKVIWYAVLKRLNGFLHLAIDTSTSAKASRVLLAKAGALIDLLPCLFDLGAISNRDKEYRAVLILANKLKEQADHINTSDNAS